MATCRHACMYDGSDLLLRLLGRLSLVSSFNLAWFTIKRGVPIGLLFTRNI
jgi:hypothetical protein